MRIRYVGGATVRQALGYEWNRENSYVAEVTDPSHAVELLTHPPGDFMVGDAEPLISLPGVGLQRVAELAALDSTGVKRLAEAIWASEKQVNKWNERTRESLTSEKEGRKEED